MCKGICRLFFAVLTFACIVSFACAESSTSTEAVSPATAAEKKKTRKKSFPAQENLLDINTATTDQLKALPGLNDEDARKIIAGRPYTRKNQLKQKKIISAAAYDGIKSSIVAKRAPK